MINSKYTFEYDSNLESKIDSICDLVAESASDSKVSRLLEFVVLGGGYGRGEGGIYISENGDKHLYNDLDFFLITKDNISPLQKKELHFHFSKLANRLREIADIDVDFSAPTPLIYIQKRMNIMVWREMVMGARVIFGDSARFQGVFKREIENSKIAPFEILKLAMNRASGLVFALEKLQNGNFDTKDRDFISRNINKAILASGDICLYSKNNLPLRISERLKILKNITSNNNLIGAYQKAVEFKKYPYFQESRESAYENLNRAAKLLESEFIKNRDIIVTKKNYSIRRRVRDFIFNIKCCHFFFGAFNDPKLMLLEAAFDILKNREFQSIDNFSDYKKIWEKIA